MLKIHELHNRESLMTLAEYCRDIFHYSRKDVESLVGKLLGGEDQKLESHVIYAECLGEMAGFIIFCYYPQNKVGFLEALVVMDEFRNQGIGAELYWNMIEMLREKHPECIGHVLEMCQDEANFLERKRFFLRQGSIPLDLGFFMKDPEVNQIRMLYHPYRIDQRYSLGLMKNILKEINSEIIH